MSLAEIAQLVSTLGVTGGLVVVVIAAWKGEWVSGRTHREAREEIEQVKRQRDRAVNGLLRAQDLNERIIALIERSMGGDDAK